VSPVSDLKSIPAEKTSPSPYKITARTSARLTSISARQRLQHRTTYRVAFFRSVERDVRELTFDSAFDKFLSHCTGS
jgi:hypothetical protein